MEYIHKPEPLIPFYKLESESSAFSNEDTESVISFQGRETEYVRDTSDTDVDSIGSEYELEIEYDVESLSDCGSNSLINTSDDSEVERGIVIAAAAAICDSSLEKWVTDGEESEFSTAEETPCRRDFWICVKCKSRNNNPSFQYCKKCFQDRKTLFPPRPRHKKPKNKRKNENPVKLENLKSCLDGFYQNSQDSGLGNSQEFLVSSKSSSIEDEDIIPSSQQDNSQTPTTSKEVTLSDIIKNIPNRKREISESSLSDSEGKRPRWRDFKKSPIKGELSSNSQLRKRKSRSNERDYSTKKRKTSDRETPTILETKSDDPSITIKDSQESIDISGKTSDLGSEISSGSGTFDKAEDSVIESNQLCIFCNSTPKNAIFLHGNSAHMCCCYRCAKKTWKTIKRCPLCNRKVNNVVRVYQT